MLVYYYLLVGSKNSYCLIVALYMDILLRTKKTEVVKFKNKNSYTIFFNQVRIYQDLKFDLARK